MSETNSNFTYEDWCKALSLCKPGFIRKGQAHFNLLYNLNPELAQEVTDTEVDPFYDDTRLPAFYKWVEENW